MRNAILFALLGMTAAFTVTGTYADGSALGMSSSDRKLLTIGPDDIAAVTAVGQAGLAAGYSAAYAAKKLAKVQKKEAFAEYRAKMRVADAMEDATRHAMKYADNPKKLAKHAVRDAAHIAEAIAEAKAIKVKAKMQSMKVVAKTMGKVAEINLKYGSKAALAVGNAAMNDVMFGPLLSGLAPAILPKLAGGLAAGPAGIKDIFGTLAGAIGGVLSQNIGLEGPDLLANRVSNLLPGNLLSSLPDMDVDVPADALSAFGGAGMDMLTNNDGDLLSGIVANMPAPVLDLVTSFLAGGSNPSSPPGMQLPTLTPEGDIVIPGAAIRAILQSVIGLMSQGGGATRLNPGFNLPLDLPNIPPAGLPFPLKQLGNLLSVLPRPDLLNIFRLLPRPPLLGLIGNLPLGLAHLN